MSIIDIENLGRFVYLLSNSKTPLAIRNAWGTHISGDQDLRLISCLEDDKEPTVKNEISQLPSEVKKLLLPYFPSENLYFASEDIFKVMQREEEIRIVVDHTVCFDSNFASYIGTIVRGLDLKDLREIVIKILDALIYHNVNFDFNFYMHENIKQIKHSGNPESKTSFWRSLRKSFRWNLVALELFKNVDCEKYRRTLSPSSSIDFRTAVKTAIDNAYYYYASDAGAARRSHAIQSQRIILLIVVKIFSIQFESRKRERAKLSALLTFMHDKLGSYFDRETLIAVMYFKDRAAVPLLQTINKGSIPARLLKKIDNIAWDIHSTRFIEEIIAGRGNGDFIIPYFLTLDGNLKKLHENFTIQSAIFDCRTLQLLPIFNVNTADHLENLGLSGITNQYFNEAARSERFTRKKPSSEEIFRMIKAEYRILRHHLMS